MIRTIGTADRRLCSSACYNHAERSDRNHARKFHRAVSRNEPAVEPRLGDDPLSRKDKGAVDKAHHRLAEDQELQRLASRINELSERQKQVMDLAVKGLSNKEIAQSLQISPRTVETYRAWVMEKTGARNIAELVRLAMRLQDSRDPTALPSEVRIANEFFEPNRRPETETQTAGEHRGASPLSPRTHQCKPEFLLGPCLHGTQQSAYATQRWEN